MKRENKSGKWIVSVLMLLVAAAVLGGSLLPYFQVDISGVVALLPQDVGNIFNEITVLLGSPEGSVAFSPATLFRVALNTGRDTAAADILFSMGMILLLSYSGILVAAVSGLFRRVWSYLLSVVFSIAGLAVTVLAAVKLMPHAVYEAIPAAFREMIALLGLDFGEEFLRDLFLDGIGVAWWISVAGYGLMLILSVVGIVLAARSRQRRGETRKQEASRRSAIGQKDTPESLENRTRQEEQEADTGKKKNFGISIGFGELNGSEIFLARGEVISIGSDERRCNVVATEEGVDQIHCQIRCDEETGNYLVRDLSQNGIFIDGRRIPVGETVTAPPGTILFLAERYTVGLI